MALEIELRGGGCLTAEQEGTRVRVSVTRPDDGRGLYKADVRGGGGRYALGTLAPASDGLLRLTRRIPVSALEQAGCWPLTGGETLLAFSFAGEDWRQERQPQLLVDDPVLKSALTGQTLLFRPEPGGFALAGRWDPCKPFPIPPLFCLARLAQIRGSRYAVFQFDRKGIPVFPDKTKKNGNTDDTT